MFPGQPTPETTPEQADTRELQTILNNIEALKAQITLLLPSRDNSDTTIVESVDNALSKINKGLVRARKIAQKELNSLQRTSANSADDNRSKAEESSTVASLWESATVSIELNPPVLDNSQYMSDAQSPTSQGSQIEAPPLNAEHQEQAAQIRTPTLGAAPPSPAPSSELDAAIQNKN